MIRSTRHVDRYTDIRAVTQADADRAAMWKRVIERKERSQRVRDRIMTLAVVACLVAVVIRLFYVVTA